MISEKKTKYIKLIPYTAAALYGEIIYFMFISTLLYGKSAAVIVGFIFSIALTLHILGLNRHKNRSRQIHCFLLLLHSTYASAYLVGVLITSASINHSAEIFLILYRGISIIIEVSALWLLTDTGIRSKIYS